MKLIKFWIKTTSLLVGFIVICNACTEDFSPVGGEILGDVNFEDEVLTIKPVAYTKVFDRVQTSNLPGNLLGTYNDPTYGTSAYSIVSQIRPTTFNPFFGQDPVLDSVVINLPYFSRAESNETETVTTSINNITGAIETETEERKTIYRLDSIYGASSDSIKLSIYKSNYFLSDFLPGEDIRRVYFSDDVNSFGSEIEGEILHDGYVSPSAKEIVLKREVVDTTNPIITKISRTRLSPRLRINFSDENQPQIKELFQNLILDNQNNPELSNNNNFLNFFRGIYFKAEPHSGGDNSLLFLDLGQANITLHYKAKRADLQDQDGDNNLTEFIEIEDTYAFNFANNIVNSINYTPSITVPEPNITEGDDNLFLKGGVGSYAVIELFGNDEDGNDIADQLEDFRENEWLINEANLKLYINQDLVTGGETEPERIYLFNLETGNVLIDYLADGSSNENNPVDSKINHLERITRDEDDNGVFYKIRLTQYVTNLLNSETENVKLGLAVSQNVNFQITAEGYTVDEEETETIIPFSSIISHEGTILYGSSNNIPDDKRLKLEIFYTASN